MDLLMLGWQSQVPAPQDRVPALADSKIKRKKKNKTKEKRKNGGKKGKEKRKGNLLNFWQRPANSTSSSQM